MNTKFVFVKSPKWDDPHYGKWHLAEMPDDWRAPLEGEADVIKRVVSGMSREEAGAWLEDMKYRHSFIDSDTVEITLE